MSRQRRLSSVLARQWALSTLVLLVGFSAMAVLLLFLLEDRFIDARLREHAANAVRDAQTLPANVQRYAFADAPPDLQARMEAAGTGNMREFRLQDGRYVHALLQERPTGLAIWVYDASDQLYVNRALTAALPWLLVLAALLALASAWLARRFIGAMMQQLQGVFDGNGGEELHARLRRVEQGSEVEEFSRLAGIAADAMQAQQDGIERERQTLSFLAHEIRTPLQSAKTSLALLDATPGNPAAWQRLRRSVARLGRASHAVLWMASEHREPLVADCDARALVDALADEFRPMLHARDMRLEVDTPERLRWRIPVEVAETVLANLLHNALQHGAAGVVRLRADGDWFEIENPYDADAANAQAGFGIGLAIVNRLLESFDVQALATRDDGRYRVRVAGL